MPAQDARGWIELGWTLTTTVMSREPELVRLNRSTTPGPRVDEFARKVESLKIARS